MHGSSITGTWIFDSGSSTMYAPVPVGWIQRVHLEHNRLAIQEEITRKTGVSTVEINAAVDGAFYPVHGSPIADEIAYWWDEGTLRGSGRKDGAEFLRESIHLSDSNRMIVNMLLLIDGKEVPLGIAHFRREDA
ncbi:hypothetical protein [Terriglobus tenax]|uniref:hypothetical protein n=1 Tax=Terriglobus tenax TaxID=1111115 RepID=UPI0021DFC7FC|nr:hypothetical protein [Terriglobus tenax]